MATFRSSSFLSDPYFKLTSQIDDEAKSIASSANLALDGKVKWVEELERIVKRAVPESKLILVGSSTNMFGFKHSDCDLTVLTTDSGHRFVSGIECLRKVESALKHRRRYDIEVSFILPHRYIIIYIYLSYSTSINTAIIYLYYLVIYLNS